MENYEIIEAMAGLPAYIQRWLRIDRTLVREHVVRSVLDAFAATPSPQEREGVSTGLDFLGLLKQEGGDNILWQVSMDLLESEIYQTVAALDADEQVALLLPWVDDHDDLGTDRWPDQWADCLRKYCDQEWMPILRRLVMDRV